MSSNFHEVHSIIMSGHADFVRHLLTIAGPRLGIAVEVDELAERHWMLGLYHDICLDNHETCVRCASYYKWKDFIYPTHKNDTFFSAL
jgi:hypothetical protein